MTADAASPDTPTDPQPNPIAGRTEADGPLFEYGLRVFYPNEGGRVTESGWTTARELAKRLRDEADQIEHIAGLLSLSGDTTREADGEGSLRSRASGTPADRIAEALREYRLTIGPNTRDSIANGMTRVHLSGGERHDIGLIAARALGLEVP